MKLMGLYPKDKRLKEYNENFEIRCIRIPDQYFGREADTERTYGEIFGDLLRMTPPVIPLAIFSKRYRNYDPANDEERQENSRRDREIVFTNPLPTAIVSKYDCII
jgi:hypothetical protein